MKSNCSTEIYDTRLQKIAYLRLCVILSFQNPKKKIQKHEHFQVEGPKNELNQYQLSCKKIQLIKNQFFGDFKTIIFKILQSCAKTL